MSSAYRLGNLTHALKGRVPAKPVPDEDGPRFFGIAEISARGRATPRYVAIGSDADDAAVLAQGDVVVALLGNIGDATVVDDTAAGAVLGRECVALRITAPDVLLPEWLCAWMSSEECSSQVAQHTTGTTMPRLSPRALETFTLTLPPVDQQREVAELVHRFDAALAVTTITLQHLESLRASELQLAIANRQDGR